MINDSWIDCMPMTRSKTCPFVGPVIIELAVVTIPRSFEPRLLAAALNQPLSDLLDLICAAAECQKLVCASARSATDVRVKGDSRAELAVALGSGTVAAVVQPFIPLGGHWNLLSPCRPLSVSLCFCARLALDLVRACRCVHHHQHLGLDPLVFLRPVPLVQYMIHGVGVGTRARSFDQVNRPSSCGLMGLGPCIHVDRSYSSGPMSRGIRARTLDALSASRVRSQIASTVGWHTWMCVSSPLAHLDPLGPINRSESQMPCMGMRRRTTCTCACCSMHFCRMHCVRQGFFFCPGTGLFPS